MRLPPLAAELTGTRAPTGIVRAAWRKWLFRLPAVLGAGLLVFQAFEIGWNGGVGAMVRGAPVRVPLPPGYVSEPPTPLSAANLASGAWQHYAANHVRSLTRMYRDATRWKYQIYYSALGMAGTPDITVGRGGELLAHDYITDYCRFDPVAMEARALPWAERLRALQDFFRARGQMFIYVVTPSKVAIHPEYLPASYPCPGRAYDGRKMEIYHPALQKAGVAFIDGPAIVRRALPDAPFDLFPRGGIHWNQLGAALAARAFIAEMDAQGAGLPQLDFDVAISHHPQDIDRDLLDLLDLNLSYEYGSYPVPVLTFHSQVDGACATRHIVEVTGSFIFEIDNTLRQLACAPDMRVYFYWNREAYHTGPIESRGGWKTHDADPSKRREDILSWADVIVLEENEEMLPESEHARALMAMVKDDLQASR